LLAAVRVRGIYATALGWLLHKRGFLLADVSDVLRGRLPFPPSGRAPDVTVKSLEDDPDYVLVLGYPWEAGEAVAQAIVEEVPDVIVRRGSLGLYTVVDAVVEEGCRARVGDLVVELDPGEGGCPGPGARVRATVVREALEEGSVPRARPGVRLVGRYVIVSVPGEGFSFSEHIRDPTVKADLLAALAGEVDTGRVHVHFRSSARIAGPEEAAREAGKLAVEAERLASQEPGEPGVVVRGEYISILGFPRTSKEALDGVRREVVPTIDYHHSLKSFGEQESTLVDCAEESMRLGASPSGAHIEVFAAKRSLGRRVVLEHHKPGGGKLRLGPFTLEAVSAGYPPELRLRRVFTRPGVLDALGVEKRPGDVGVTRVRPREWFLVHEYLNPSGGLLGVYANVNTPVEVGFGRIKYFDLYVDVVKKPGEDPRIVDVEQLEDARRRGVVPDSLYEKALEVAEYLARRLASTYP